MQNLVSQTTRLASGGHQCVRTSEYFNDAHAQNGSFMCTKTRLPLEAEHVFHVRSLKDYLGDERLRDLPAYGLEHPAAWFGETAEHALSGVSGNEPGGGPPKAEPGGRGAAGGGARMRAFVIHLETAAADVRRLEAHLCRSAGYCEALPPFPGRVLAGDLDTFNNDGRVCVLHTPSATLRNCAITWEELWTPEAQAVVRRLFRWDFAVLGYDESITHLLPVAGHN